MTHHVVLVTYGEPPSPGYLDQLRYSWRILLGLTRAVAPIPAPVLPLIALKRAWLRRRSWIAEQYGSPLEPLTRKQADGLAGALRRLAPDTTWQVQVGYEFRDPTLGEVLDRMPPGDPINIVPMYVADSAFTHDVTRGALARWALSSTGSSRSPRRIAVILPLDDEVLGPISVRHVRRELAQAGWRGGADTALVLAAHGTLETPPRPMETGREATERLCRRIAFGLRGDFGMIQNGWLNHVYGGRWTQPPVEEALRQVAEAGFRRLVYYPYGFLADNAESQLEGRIALRAQPELEALHLPCLNDSPEYLGALAERLTGLPHANPDEATGTD